jgi:dipeptidyl aminopeptidase/acylaminoacyl peptidase
MQRKGEVFVQRIDEAAPSITPRPKVEPGPRLRRPAKDDEPESFSVTAFSRDGARVLLTSKRGWYVASVADGARERVLTLDDTHEERNPKLTFVDWTPGGDGLLVQYGEPDRWRRGLSRLDLRTRQLLPLVADASLYQRFQVSRDGSTVIFQKSDGDRPADLYAADAGMTNVRKLTDLNPWIAQTSVPTSELVSYRDADGKVLHGVLRYPVGYEKGKRYGLRDLGDVLRQRLQRPGGAAGQPWLRRVPSSVNLVVGRPRRVGAKG